MNWSRSKHLRAPPEDISALTVNVADELSQRKEKELNVVIYGLPELVDTNADEPSEEEEQEATSKFLTEQLQVADPSLTRTFRMGRRQAERPRPLKVMFSDATKRSDTLSSAKSLG